MQDELTILGNSLEDIEAEWKGYRASCFLRCEEMRVWVWAAHFEFEFMTVAAHFLSLPVAGFDYGPEAFTMTVFGDVHLIPFSRMSTASLRHLEPQYGEPLLRHRDALRAKQVQAEQALKSVTSARLLMNERACDAQQLH